jgi:hypothetical protein
MVMIMAGALLPLATVRGRVRSAEGLERTTDTGARETFAARLQVLTEPNGGFLDVTVWPRDLPLSESLALAGVDVEVVVSLGVYVSKSGAGYAQATFVSFVAEPVAAGV